MSYNFPPKHASIFGWTLLEDPVVACMIPNSHLPEVRQVLPSHLSIYHVPFPSIPTRLKSKNLKQTHLLGSFNLVRLVRNSPPLKGPAKLLQQPDSLGLGHCWLPLHLRTLRTKRQHQQHFCSCWRYVGIHYSSNYVTWIGGTWWNQGAFSQYPEKSRGIYGHHPFLSIFHVLGEVKDHHTSHHLAWSC